MDATNAKLAAPPGFCNPPDDETPCVGGTPTPEQIEKNDSRTPGQRTHDALKTVYTAMLSSGELGQHNGLPVTIVVTTSLEQLTSAAGWRTPAAAPICPCRQLSEWPPRPIPT